LLIVAKEITLNSTKKGFHQFSGGKFLRLLPVTYIVQLKAVLFIFSVLILW